MLPAQMQSRHVASILGIILSPPTRTLAKEKAMNLKRIRAAREELVKRGVLIDSGEKRMNPRTKKWETAWMLNPNLTEEQQNALVEQPDAKDRH
jgi:hypothetical protein